MTTPRHDFSTATRVRNVTTGTVYKRDPGTNVWTQLTPPWTVETVTTEQLEGLAEMVAEDE